MTDLAGPWDSATPNIDTKEPARQFIKTCDDGGFTIETVAQVKLDKACTAKDIKVKIRAEESEVEGLIDVYASLPRQNNHTHLTSMHFPLDSVEINQIYIVIRPSRDGCHQILNIVFPHTQDNIIEQKVQSSLALD